MKHASILVAVIVRSAAHRSVVPSIKRWCRNTQDPPWKGAVSSVSEQRDLYAARSFLCEHPDSGIVIASGFYYDEVARAVQAVPDDQRVVIVHEPRGPPARYCMPSASVFERAPLVATGSPIPALKKAILRRKAAICRLRTDEEFRQYFALRYQVWRSLNYVPAEKLCSDSEWELDYSDRTAYPIGAFSKKGILVGCARLVMGFGHEIPHVPLIKRLIGESGDDCLRRVFRYPRGAEHPFDLLESFPGFRAYFRDLVVSRQSYAEVSRIIVRPHYRRRGLGETLVDSLVSVARAESVNVLFLGCLAKHRQFYQRSGFAELEGMRCDRFVNVRVPAIAMVRSLDRS